MTQKLLTRLIRVRIFIAHNFRQLVLNDLYRRLRGQMLLTRAHFNKLRQNFEKAGDLYIDAFFDGIGWRSLKQSQSALAGLQAVAIQQSEFRPWYHYLTGILTNEFKDDGHYNWPKAITIFRDLLALDDLDDDLYLRGKVLLALGRTYEYLGSWDEAIDVYEKSLNIFIELDQTIDQAKVLKQIANVWYRKFNQGTARDEDLLREIANCQRALALIEPVTVSDINALDEKGKILNTIGLLYFSLNKLAETLDYYSQELAICRKLNDPYGQALTLGNLGEVRQKLGNLSSAQVAFETALKIIQRVGDLYEEIEVRANLGYLYQQWEKHDLAIENYNQAIALIEKLLEDIPDEKYRIAFFATAEEVYANLVLLAWEADHQTQAFDYVERARSRAFLYALTTRLSESIQAAEATPLTLPEVQAALPARAMILEYFTTDLEKTRLSKDAEKAGIRRHRLPPKKTLIFAITRDEVEIQDLKLPLEKLRPSDRYKVIERYFLRPDMGRFLYDHLITPVERLLPDKDWIYLIPHGILHYVPFQALLAADGDTLLRPAGPQLIYSPSATLLFRHWQVPANQSLKPGLTLGYNGQGRLQLRFAESEARKVTQLTAGRCLVGDSPKKETLFQSGPEYRLLHFSCHGYFDAEDFLKSYLYVAPNEYLSVQDVFEHLHLRCDLVTLSACESGLNWVGPGDELGGFVRAFFYAGARMLIVTLWRVDELSTWILMDQFYKAIQTGLAIAEALKQAQLYLKNLTYKQLQAYATEDEFGLSVRTLLEEVTEEEEDGKPFADPYYWGPFVIIGHCQKDQEKSNQVV